MYEVRRHLKDWFREPIQTETFPEDLVASREEDMGAAIDLAERLAAKRSDEVLEIRQHPGDICVWVSDEEFGPSLGLVKSNSTSRKEQQK